MIMAVARRAVAAVVAFSVHRAAVVAAVYVILVAASLWATVNYLEINTDSRGMLNQELPFQKRTAALEDAFPHLLNSIIVVVRSDVPDAADETVAALVDTLPGRPGIASAFAESASPFFRSHGVLYQDASALEASLKALAASADLLAAVAETPTANTLLSGLSVIHSNAGSDAATTQTLDRVYGNIASVLESLAAGETAALSWQTLMDEDGDGTGVTRLVQVTPELDFTALQPAEAALDSINAAIAALPERVDPLTAELVTVEVTGEPVLMFEELEAVADGIGLSMGTSLIAVIILLVICYRSVRRTVVTLAAIIVALVLALGFASVTLGPLNLVSIAFVVPLVGLGLDFAIHVTTRAAELERGGLTQKEAFVGAGRAIALALGLSAFTTAAAFMSFVGTDFVGMGQVGILGAVGVLIAFAISLTLVPALSTIGGSSVAQTAGDGPEAKRPTAPSNVWRVARQVATVVLAALALGSVALAPDVRFDTDPMNLRDPESPSMVALAGLMSAPETAPYRMSLAGTQDAVAAFAAASDEAVEADAVITLTRLVPDDQAEKLALLERMHPGIVARAFGPARMPAASDDAAGAFAEALTRRSTGPGADRLRAALDGHSGASTRDWDLPLTAYLPPMMAQLRAQADARAVAVGDLPAPLRERFLSGDGLARAEVAPAYDLRDGDNRTRFVAELIEIDPEAAGAPLEISRAGEVVSGAMVQATGLAALVVTVMCPLVLRSVRETLAVLLPLVIAGLLVVGAMVFFDLPFNYANVIVLPLIIGLGVDSSIHLAVRKREEESGSVYATSTPRAVLFSGLTTAVAFVSLALSSHRGTASMGELLGLSIAIVLVTTIVATPTLLELFKPSQRSHA